MTNSIDLQEMVELSQRDYQSLMERTIEKWLKYKLPGIQNVEITRQRDGSSLLSCDEGTYTRDEIINCLNEAKKL